ncbi:MAG TPA: FtsX-like permease family protein [Mycobacteriales bacterium]|jgi:hypothetical protein|nr:FtsX-like permease family protein [Mycobacteriales bacterium]
MRRQRRAGVAVRLLARGVAHRRWLSALILLLAVVACAAAAVAPIYRTAATVSALRARMTAASPQNSGVEVAGASWPGDSPDQILAREVPRLPLSSAKISGMTVGGRNTQLQVPGKFGEFAALTWRQDDCAHVVFQSGRCPTARNEIALPASAAGVLGAKLGGPIVASNLDQPQFGAVTTITGEVVPTPPSQIGKGLDLNDTVVGIFNVPPGESTYWFGQDISAPIISGDGAQVATVTALVTHAALVALPPPYRANVTVDEPLDWSHATPADALRVQSALSHLKVRHQRNLSVFTQIPGMLAADAADRSQLSHLVTLAQLQLLLLVGLVLIAILAASMDRRRAELVIATLQGRRPASTAVSVSAEPVLLLVLGIVPGLIVSLPLAALASHLWLRSGTPIRLTVSAVVAALVVTVIAAAVTVVIGYVAASRSLTDQLAEDARSAGGRGGAWIDIVAITLAAAGLTELLASHSGTSTPWSLLAPSLCGLAAGLALGRLIPFLLRPVVRATARSRRLGSFLAIRELRRDHAAWRVAAVVALALTLLTFAVSVNRGAASDRQDRAGLIVGAPTVATVFVPPGRSLLAAVDKADPSGRWAMAAELLAPLGSPAQRALAIDTPRLAAVAGWSRRLDGYTPDGIARILHVPAAVARSEVPLMTAGDVEGSTFGLNNQPLPRARVYQTSLLPQLLGQGALADLSSFIDVAKPIPQARLGTTQLTDQVWIGEHAPADALSRLRSAGLLVTSVETRASVVRRLQGSAETAGLSGYLAVGVIAAILAVGLLIGTSAAALSRQRSETLALTLAAVPPSDVIRGRAAAVAARLVLVAVAALSCGIGTAHLAAHLIPQAPRGAVPVPLLPLPVLPALLAVAATLVPALLAEVVIARYAAKRADAASLRTVTP